MTVLFIVRAHLEDPSVRDDFDRWYEDEHLPDALAAFGARRAWRGWSETEADVHYACYELPDLERAQAIQSPEILGRLVAEFDRLWGERVSRSRDVVPVAQTLEG